MHLHLIRHPKPDVAPGQCYGRRDVGLLEAAQPCARRLRALLPQQYTLYSSPLARARELAQRLGPAVIDPRLQEMDFGEWEGRSYDTLRQELEPWAADPLGFRPPGGETGREVASRIWSFHLDKVVTSETNVVVVGHSGPFRLWLAQLLGIPLDQHHIFHLDFARLTSIELQEDRLRLLGLNL